MSNLLTSRGPKTNNYLVKVALQLVSPHIQTLGPKPAPEQHHLVSVGQITSIYEKWLPGKENNASSPQFSQLLSPFLLLLVIWTVYLLFASLFDIQKEREEDELHKMIKYNEKCLQSNTSPTDGSTDVLSSSMFACICSFTSVGRVIVNWGRGNIVSKLHRQKKKKSNSRLGRKTWWWSLFYGTLFSQSQVHLSPILLLFQKDLKLWFCQQACRQNLIWLCCCYHWGREVLLVFLLYGFVLYGGFLKIS